MCVTDQNQVRRWEARIVRLAPWIDMNDFAAEFQHHASVIQRGELERTPRGLDYVGLPIGKHGAKRDRKAQHKYEFHRKQLLPWHYTCLRVRCRIQVMRYLVRARVKPGREEPLLKAIENETLGKGSVAEGEYLRNMAQARLLEDGT